MGGLVAALPKLPSTKTGLNVSLNIGTLVGYLQLDDANFERKADAADRKMSALRRHRISTIRNVPIAPTYRDVE